MIDATRGIESQDLNIFSLIQKNRKGFVVCVNKWDLIENKECSVSGVKVFIENLRKQNYKIGLATNSPKRIITTVLNKFDISHLFDTVSSAEFENMGKPHPAIYINTAKKLDVEPKNCIAIEDSYSGMLAAKSAGMTVCAFTNGNKNVNFKIADFKIDHFEYSIIDLPIT